MFLTQSGFQKPVSTTQLGSSLIEILVSLLVIGVGMLGVASLQVYSLSSVKVSSVHTRASQLTENLAERMRANPDAVAAGEFTAIEIDTTEDPPAAPGNLCRDPDDACTAAEFVDADLWLWEIMARTTLPAGATISIDCNGGAGSCTTDNAHVVTMQWEEETRKGVKEAGYTTVIQP